MKKYCIHFLVCQERFPESDCESCKHCDIKPFKPGTIAYYLSKTDDGNWKICCSKVKQIISDESGNYYQCCDGKCFTDDDYNFGVYKRKNKAEFEAKFYRVGFGEMRDELRKHGYCWLDVEKKSGLSHDWFVQNVRNQVKSKKSERLIRKAYSEVMSEIFKEY